MKTLVQYVWVLLYAHILINKECCSSMLLFLQMVIKIIDKDPLPCLHSSQFPSCCTCKYCLEILHVPQSVLFYLTCKFSYSVCEHKLERRLETPQWLSYQNIWNSNLSWSLFCLLGELFTHFPYQSWMLLTLNIFLLWSYPDHIVVCMLHWTKSQ